MCSCGGPKKPPSDTPQSLLSSSGNFSDASLSMVIDRSTGIQMVMMEYIGPVKETFTINSRVTNQVKYRFGDNPQHKSKPVFLQDAEFLMSLFTGEKPNFRAISNAGISEAHDPTEFLSQPLVAA